MEWWAWGMLGAALWLAFGFAGAGLLRPVDRAHTLLTLACGPVSLAAGVLDRRRGRR